MKYYQQICSLVLQSSGMDLSVLPIDLTQSLNMNQYMYLYKQQYEQIQSQIESVFHTKADLEKERNELKETNERLQFKYNQYKQEKEEFYNTICLLSNDFQDLYKQFQHLVSEPMKSSIQNPLYKSSLLDQNLSPNTLIDYYKNRTNSMKSSTSTMEMKMVKQQETISQLNQFINETTNNMNNIKQAKQQVDNQMKQYESMIHEYEQQITQLKKENDLLRISNTDNQQLQSLYTQLTHEKEQLSSSMDTMKLQLLEKNTTLQQYEKEKEEWRKKEEEIDKLKEDYEYELYVKLEQIDKNEQTIKQQEELIQKLKEDLNQLDQQSKSVIENTNLNLLLKDEQAKNNELSTKYQSLQKEYQVLKNQKEEKEKENEEWKEIKQQYESLQTQYHAVLDQQSSLLQENAQYMSQVHEMEAKYQLLLNQKNEMEQQYNELYNENEQLKIKIEEKTIELNQLNDTLLTNTASLVKDELLQQPSENYDYFKNLLEEKNKEIQALNDQIKEKDIHMNTLEKEKRSLAQLNQDYESKGIRNEKILNDYNELKASYQEQERELNSIKQSSKQYELKVIQLNNEIEELKQEKLQNESFKQLYESLYENYQLLNNQYKELQTKYSLYQNTSTEVSKSQIESENSIHSKYVDMLNQQYNELDQQYNELKEQYESYQQEQELHLKEQEKEYETKLNEKQKEIQLCKQHEDELNQRIQSLEQEMNKTTNDFAVAANEVNQFLNGYQQLSEEYKQIKGKEEKNQEEISKLKRQLLQSENDKQQRINDYTRLSSQYQSLNELYQQLHIIQERRDSIKKSATNLTDDTASENSLINSNDTETMITALNEELRKRNDELIQLNNQLSTENASLKQQYDQNQQYEQLYNELKDQMKIITKEKDQHESKIHQLNKQCYQLQEENNKYKKLNSYEHNSLEQLKKDRENEKNYYEKKIENYKNQLATRDSKIQKLKEEYKQVYQTLSPKRNYSMMNSSLNVSVIDQSMNMQLQKENTQLKHMNHQITTTINQWKEKCSKYKELAQQYKSTILDLHSIINDITEEIRNSLDSTLAFYTKKEIHFDDSILDYENIRVEDIHYIIEARMNQIDSLLQKVNEKNNNELLMKKMDAISNKNKELLKELARDKQSIDKYQLTQKQNLNTIHSYEHQINEMKIESSQRKQQEDVEMNQLHVQYQTNEKNYTTFMKQYYDLYNQFESMLKTMNQSMNEYSESNKRLLHEKEEVIAEQEKQINQLKQDKQVVDNEITNIYNMLEELEKNSAENELPSCYHLLKTKTAKQLLHRIFTRYSEFNKCSKSLQFYQDQYNNMISKIQDHSSSLLSYLEQNKVAYNETVVKHIERIKNDNDELKQIYDQLYAHYDEKVKEKKKEINALENQLFSSKNEYENVIEKYKQQILQANEIVSFSNQQISELSNTNKLYEQQLYQQNKVIEDWKNNFEAIQSKIKLLDAQYYNYIAGQAKNKDQFMDYSEMKSQSDQYKSIHQQYTLLLNDYNQMKEEMNHSIEEIKQKVEGRYNHLIDYIDEIAVFDMSNEQKKEGIQSIKNSSVFLEYNELKENVKELEKSNEQLKLENQRLLQKKNQYEKQYKRNIHIDDLIHDMHDLLDIQNDLNGNSGLLTRKTELEQRIKQISEEIKKRETDYQSNEWVQKQKHLLEYYQSEYDYLQYVFAHSKRLEKRSLNISEDMSFVDAETNVSFLNDKDQHENILSCSFNHTLPTISEEEDEEDDYYTVQSKNTEEQQGQFSFSSWASMNSSSFVVMTLSTFLYRMSCLKCNIYPLNFLLQLEDQDAQYYHTNTLHVHCLHDIFRFISMLYIHYKEENSKLSEQVHSLQKKSNAMNELLRIVNEQHYHTNESMTEDKICSYISQILISIQSLQSQNELSASIKNQLDQSIRSNNEYTKKIEELTRENQQHKDNEKNIQKEIEDAKKTIQQVDSENQKLKEELNRIKEQQRESEDHYRNQISSLSNEKSQLEKEKNQLVMEMNQYKTQQEEQSEMNRNGFVRSAYTYEVGMELIKFFKSILHIDHLSLENTTSFMMNINQCKNKLKKISDDFRNLKDEYKELMKQYSLQQNANKKNSQVIEALKQKMSKQTEDIIRLKDIIVRFMRDIDDK